MITKVDGISNTPDVVQSTFNSFKPDGVPNPNKAVGDNVHLSAEAIQKAETGYELPQNVQELLSAEQQENIDKLIADLKAMQEKSEVTDEQKETLKNDLKSTLHGAQEPSSEAIENFAAHFAEIIYDGQIDLDEIKTLQEDINVILNSASISDEQIQILKADLEAIADSSNIGEEDLEIVWNNMVEVVETARLNSNL